MNQITLKSPSRDLSSNTMDGGNSWRTDLDKTEKGAIVPSLSNARRIIMWHPYLKDCFRWSEFDEAPMLMRPLPCHRSEGLLSPDPHGVYPQRCTDKFLTYLQDVISVIAEASFKDQQIAKAIQNAAMQNPYNPIRDYLEILKWDGAPRLNHWMHYGLGVGETDLNAKMGRMFLIAACRRAYFKKYKFDSMLILEGPKGLQKSTACRVLFGDEYFVEGVGDIRKEETVKKLAGKWAAEIPEGNGFLNASSEAQKEFLSKEADTYRRAYQVFDCTVPRRFVLIMTTNASEYLQESEIDRRFWVVKCGEDHLPDIAWLRENRDQIWAEAYHYAMLRDENGRLNENTFLDGHDMKDLGYAQLIRVIDDPWGNIIRHHIQSGGKDRDRLSSMEILSNLLGIPIDRQDRSAATKVGCIMRDLGWKKIRTTHDGQREYVYVRPTSE